MFSILKTVLCRHTTLISSHVARVSIATRRHLKRRHQSKHQSIGLPCWRSWRSHCRGPTTMYCNQTAVRIESMPRKCCAIFRARQGDDVWIRHQISEDGRWSLSVYQVTRQLQSHLLSDESMVVDWKKNQCRPDSGLPHWLWDLF